LGSGRNCTLLRRNPIWQGWTDPSAIDPRSEPAGEVSDGPIATPAGTSNVHRIGALHFDDLVAIEKAFAGAEEQAARADRRFFAPDDSGVQMFLFDKREV
jgi:hypothetical protein